MKKKNVYVHPSSYVDKSAQIGEGTKIWHFCHIMKGAMLGKKCKIGQNVVVHGTAKIGNNRDAFIIHLFCSGCIWELDGLGKWCRV